MPAKTLYLIDGHAQIYRAFYAPFGALTAPTGEPTRAVYVFTQMLLNLLRDRSRTTWRWSWTPLRRRSSGGYPEIMSSGKVMMWAPA
jgi:5'-3' exonuclease